MLGAGLTLWCEVCHPAFPAPRPQAQGASARRGATGSTGAGAEAPQGWREEVAGLTLALGNCPAGVPVPAHSHGLPQHQSPGPFPRFALMME